MENLRDWRAALVLDSRWLLRNHHWNLEFIYCVEEVTPQQVLFRRGAGGTVAYDYPNYKEVSFSNGAMTINRDGIPFVTFRQL